MHPPRPSPAPLERLLQEAAETVRPKAAQKQSMKNALMRRIDAPSILQEARDAVQPAHGLLGVVWQRVRNRIEPNAHSLWNPARSAATPDDFAARRLWSGIVERLLPVSRKPVMQRWFKLTVAFALVLVTVRLSPLLFIAVPSSADSDVLLRPSEGQVSVLIGGLWQPVTEEITLHGAALIRTDDEGYATLIIHDDGVLRLGTGTTISLNDITDRPSRTDEPLPTPTIALESGTLWVQALIPEAIGPGWTVGTPEGRVLVNQGSLSLAVKDGLVDLQVWNRLARVLHPGGTPTSLIAGEHTELHAGRRTIVQKIPTVQDNAWVNDNLQRDAVHRKEIAFFQQQRRAQSAGILPTSSLYPVKRAAETVDVLLTFGKEARVRKILDQANTRLNEAAALITQHGGSGAEIAQKPLEEYKETLLAVAAGSGQDLAVQQLVQEQVADEVADVTAASPEDVGYVLKRTVLEASASLEGGLNPADVQGSVLADTLTTLASRVREGDVENAKKEFAALESILAEANDPSSDLSPQLREETKAALTAFTEALLAQEAPQDQTGSLVVTEPERPRTRQVAKPLSRPLTDDEVAAFVQRIIRRIFLYKQPRSRYNQLLQEFRDIQDHPDQGRILRKLHLELPQDGLGRYVRTEIQQVREKVGCPTGCASSSASSEDFLQ